MAATKVYFAARTEGCWGKPWVCRQLGKTQLSNEQSKLQWRGCAKTRWCLDLEKEMLEKSQNVDWICQGSPSVWDLSRWTMKISETVDHSWQKKNPKHALSTWQTNSGEQWTPCTKQQPRLGAGLQGTCSAWCPGWAGRCWVCHSPAG